MQKRVKLLVVICGVLCATVGVTAPAHTQDYTRDRARDIFELTNRDRVARGLQPLRWSASLAAAAQTHAVRMAGEKYLSHEYPGEGNLGERAAQAGSHFEAIAENIATGYSDAMLEAEWMNSAPHRQNILDPQMNSLGVGVVERGGSLFAVEDFSNAVDALSAGEIERKVGELLRREGIDPTAPREGAARACLSNSGYPRGSTGKLVLRFDTSDLSRLPGEVEGPVRSGHFSRASVATCEGGSQGNFTSYRVAIVLY
jgi:uncharacterized protein YkwD